MNRKKSFNLFLISILLVSVSLSQDFETPESLLKQIMEPGESFDLGLNENHITALKIDPNNPMVILAGSIPDPHNRINGKVFRSSNAGVTWQECLDKVNIIDIDIDSRTPGIALATSGNQTNISPNLYKSDDFGKNWRTIRHPLYNRYERPVFTRISPWNSSHYFGATTSTEKGYLYFSPDSGKTWQDITCRYFEGPPKDISFNPFIENDLIISIENHTQRPPLMRSLDNGESWKHIWTFDQDIVEFVKFDPDSAGTIHVSLRGKGLYTSYDNGESWFIRTKGLKQGSTAYDLVVMEDGYYTVVSLGTSSRVFCMKNDEIAWERFAWSNYGKNPQLERYKNFLYVGSGGIQVYWIEEENIRKVHE